MHFRSSSRKRNINTLVTVTVTVTVRDRVPSGLRISDSLFCLTHSTMAPSGVQQVLPMNCTVWRSGGHRLATAVEVSVNVGTRRTVDAPFHHWRPRFPVAASRVWNSLPSSVTSSTSLTVFTALHCMQRGPSDRKSVRLSVTA